jgi:hypothetical protein
MNGPPVPERYHGVWARTLLETPAGRDTTTFVRWLQTEHWHADLRIPLTARAGEGAGDLALQQGFCGITTVEQQAGREVCTWQRRLDFQPPGLTPDAGYIEFDGTERLVETGVHGSYLEVWERLPGSAGPVAMLEFIGDDGCRSRWLRAGAWAMRIRPRALGWPADTRAGESLAELVQRHPAARAGLLDFEISFGPLRDTPAGLYWQIEQSTLLALVGSETRLADLMAGAQALAPGSDTAGWR